MTDRKRQFGAWLVDTLIGIPVLYLLSFGPACWCFRASPDDPVARIYWPIGWIAEDPKQGPIFRAVSWYATLLRGGTVIVPSDPSGGSAVFLLSEADKKLELERARYYHPEL